MDTTDTLRYDRWIEDALKSVVRKALQHCQEHGLPGEHHFYVTFATNHEGVIIPESLMEQYPEEITIVIEHEFWDLEVTQEYFDVVLSFNDERTPIHVPFDAVSGFADPSVKFGLQFKMETLDDLEEELEEEEPLPEDADEEKGDDNGDNVVALDAFRKKK